MQRYSSVSAFLAHYQTLRKIPDSSMSDDDRNRLAAMEKLLDVLRPEEREAAASDTNDAATVRHRERAAIRLRRELTARGVLES